MILSDRKVIKHMKRVLAIVCLVVVALAFMVSVIHDGLTEGCAHVESYLPGYIGSVNSPDRGDFFNKVSEPATDWLLLAGLVVFAVFRGK